MHEGWLETLQTVHQHLLNAWGVTWNIANCSPTFAECMRGDLKHCKLFTNICWMHEGWLETLQTVPQHLLNAWGVTWNIANCPPTFAECMRGDLKHGKLFTNSFPLAWEEAYQSTAWLSARSLQTIQPGKQRLCNVINNRDKPTDSHYFIPNSNGSDIASHEFENIFLNS